MFTTVVDFFKRIVPWSTRKSPKRKLSDVTDIDSDTQIKRRREFPVAPQHFSVEEMETDENIVPNRMVTRSQTRLSASASGKNDVALDTPQKLVDRTSQGRADFSNRKSDISSKQQDVYNVSLLQNETSTSTRKRTSVTRKGRRSVVSQMRATVSPEISVDLTGEPDEEEKPTVLSYVSPGSTSRNNLVNARSQTLQDMRAYEELLQQYMDFCNIRDSRSVSSMSPIVQHSTSPSDRVLRPRVTRYTSLSKLALGAASSLSSSHEEIDTLPIITECDTEMMFPPLRRHESLPSKLNIMKREDSVPQIMTDIIMKLKQRGRENEMKLQKLTEKVDRNNSIIDRAGMGSVQVCDLMRSFKNRGQGCFVRNIAVRNQYMDVKSVLEAFRKLTNKRGNEIVCGTPKGSVDPNDLKTLKPEKWLNDQVINVYLDLIVMRSEQPEWTGLKVYSLSTFFFSTLLSGRAHSNDYNYQRVRRHTKNVDIFAKDILLIPIHISSHWTLAVVDMRRKVMEHYDSLYRYSRGRAQHVFRHLTRYLQDECKEKKGMLFSMEEEWESYDVGPRTPQQNNTSDCGVFTCIIAEHIAREAPLNFSASDMLYYRGKMMFDLVIGSIQPWDSKPKTRSFRTLSLNF